MNENFLHYIWKHRLFDLKNLTTINGESLTILSCGTHNHQAGPDFLQAKIKIENVVWAGNIEIHLRSSDFEKHHHQHDAAYKNVVLHVVFEHDKEINSQQMPTLELKGLIPLHLLRNFENLQKNTDWIPCEKNISSVSNLLLNQLSSESMAVIGLLKSGLAGNAKESPVALLPGDGIKNSRCLNCLMGARCCCGIACVTSGRN